MFPPNQRGSRTKKAQNHPNPVILMHETCFKIPFKSWEKKVFLADICFESMIYPT